MTDGRDWEVSFCGLNCARCKMVEQEGCGGCRGPVEKNWSPGCQFRPCALAKGVDYCFQCEQFPCEGIEAFASDGCDHHRLAVENMKKMLEMGLDEWKASQPSVMFCPGWFF